MPRHQRVAPAIPPVRWLVVVQRPSPAYAGAVPLAHEEQQGWPVRLAGRKKGARWDRPPSTNSGAIVPRGKGLSVENFGLCPIVRRRPTRGSPAQPIHYSDQG